MAQSGAMNRREFGLALAGGLVASGMRAGDARQDDPVAIYKRSIVLDLKTEGGRETLFRLAAGADVFVQNFRPGVADRLGVGEQPVRAVSPKIVYVSISGFGEMGPFSAKPVYDPLVQALFAPACVVVAEEAAPAWPQRARQALRVATQRLTEALA